MSSHTVLQLRESINYELSHDWRLLDTDDSGSLLPRMRIEVTASAGDGKRKNSKMSRLFTQSQHSVQSFNASSASRNSLSLARVNVLADFNDMDIRFPPLLSLRVVSAGVFRLFIPFYPQRLGRRERSVHYGEGNGGRSTPGRKWRWPREFCDPAGAAARLSCCTI